MIHNIKKEWKDITVEEFDKISRIFNSKASDQQKVEKVKELIGEDLDFLYTELKTNKKRKKVGCLGVIKPKDVTVEQHKRFEKYTKEGRFVEALCVLLKSERGKVEDEVKKISIVDFYELNNYLSYSYLKIVRRFTGDTVIYAGKTVFKAGISTFWSLLKAKIKGFFKKSK